MHMFTLTSHIFKVSLLNFTVLGKNNFTIGIHGHGWLFPSKLKDKLLIVLKQETGSGKTRQKCYNYKGHIVDKP